MNGNMTFAKRIKDLREKNGDSQESLAAIFNYSKQAVSNWEVSGKVPRSNVLEKLAERYRTSSDYLLGFTDDTTPSSKSTSKEPKRPKDLAKILEQREDLMFNGVPLDDEAKKDILHVIEFELYRRAKDLNKRKKDS